MLLLKGLHMLTQNKIADTLAGEVYMLDVEINNARSRISIWEMKLFPNDGQKKMIEKEYEYLACLKQAKNIYSDRCSRLLIKGE